MVFEANKCEIHPLFLGDLWHVCDRSFIMVVNCLQYFTWQLLKLIFLINFVGKAKGVLFEDDGDGYGFKEGQFLLTHYTAELESSVVTVRVFKSEGSWKRPKRRLNVQLLLGGGAIVCLLFLSNYH